MKMRVYLKGGSDFAIEVEEFETKRDRITGGLHALEWKYPDKHKVRLPYLDLAQVAAIVRED